MSKTIFNYIHRFLFKLRSLFVNIIISAIKYKYIAFNRAKKSLIKVL